ncbi:hypothetical protein [Nocardioides sp.]|uniref:hypothetical protein n=1 Tax=Nocardioides sp. TaxID=35761 RepID=UPI003565B676
MSMDRFRVVVAFPADEAADEAAGAAGGAGGGTSGSADAALVRSLRDAGHEVVQVRAPGAEQLAATAVQEDVDLVVVRRGPATSGEYDARLRAALDGADATDVAVLTLGADEPARLVLEHLHAH